MNVANVLFGPPSRPCELVPMLELFFSSQGVHIVCGGTTAGLAASFLGKSVGTDLRYPKSGLPPIGRIEGVDLVTEGVVTMSCVIERLEGLAACRAAEPRFGRQFDLLRRDPSAPCGTGGCVASSSDDALSLGGSSFKGDALFESDAAFQDDATLQDGASPQDGASLIIHHLLHHADVVNLFVGCALNPASVGAGPLAGLRPSISHELALCLSRNGKKVVARYF